MKGKPYYIYTELFLYNKQVNILLNMIQIKIDQRSYKNGRQKIKEVCDQTRLLSKINFSIDQKVTIDFQYIFDQRKAYLRNQNRF